MRGYAVVDLETTGFSPAKHDRVVEVAVVSLEADGRLEDEWCTLVNPQRDLGPQSVHGVRAVDARRAPAFDLVGPHLAARLDGRVLVAHNLAFDALFLGAEFRRLGVDAPVKHRAGLCTMTLSDEYLATPSRSLAACCAHAGIRQEGSHTALGDARAAAGLLAHYLRVAGQPPPWHALAAGLVPWDWPVPPARGPAPSTHRSSPGDERPGDWLESLVDRMPRVHVPPTADAYLAVLDTALLDRYLSGVEQDSLVALAGELDLSRSDVLLLHRNYLHALAALAWADGVVTDEEQADLVHVAGLLGLSRDEVHSAVQSAQAAAGSEPPARTGFRLRPGDLVVFTGEMRRPRAEWIDAAEQAGLRVSLKTITKKTALLVAADPDSMSGKAQAAAKKGVPVVGEETFERLLAEVERPA